MEKLKAEHQEKNAWEFEVYYPQDIMLPIKRK